MSGRKGDCVVEEEERSPPVRLVQRVAPAAKLRHADDPQRTVVMAGERPRVVDEAAAISGEAHPLRHRMQVPERVDTVPTGHAAVSRGDGLYNDRKFAHTVE